MANKRPPETVFDELKDFIPPRSTGSVDIDPRVINDPFREAIAFASPMTLDEAEDWYDHRFCVSLISRSAHDAGQRTIDFQSDAKGRSVNVALFDTKEPDALDAISCFSGYMGLERLVDSSPGLIGLLKLEDLNETIARMKANGEWPPDGTG